MPRRIEAVIKAKGGSTKYLPGGITTVRTRSHSINVDY